MSDFHEFDPELHRYFTNGVEYVAVSRVLEHAGLVSDYCRDPAAAQRGREVHHWCHEDSGITNTVDLRRVPPKYRGYLRAYRAWRRDTGFLPAASEQIVTCDAPRYCGTFDQLGVLPGQPIAETIIDLKSGAVPLYTKYQLVAYAHGVEPGKVFNRIGLQLRADGTYNCRPFPTAEFFTDRAHWLNLVNNYHHQQENKSGTGSTDTTAEHCGSGSQGAGVAPGISGG